MADDNDDWFGGGDDEPAPVIKPIGKAAKEAEQAEAAAAAEAAGGDGGEAGAAEGQEEAKEEAADEEYLDPDKLILFKHWIRPKFLPYKYIYDYRRSYYDDVMEVLDSRKRGVRRNIPPAQSFAERLCRYRNDPIYKLNSFDKVLDDVRLTTRTEISGNFYTYYSKEQFNRRYSKLLF